MEDTGAVAPDYGGQIMQNGNAVKDRYELAHLVLDDGEVAG